MQKTPAYHESAIAYNEGLAEAAEKLAPTLEHEEPRKWCIAVGKQHRFHAKRHRSALSKLLAKQEAPPVERIPDGLDVPDPDDAGVETTTNAEDLKITHDPVSPVVSDTSAEASEVEVVTDEDGEQKPAEGAQAEPVNDEQQFSDGCVGTHQPMQESCEFYPKGN